MKRLLIFIITVTLSGFLYSQNEIKQNVKPGDKKIFTGIVMSFIPGDGTIPSFYIGRYEITQEQYIAIMGKLPKGGVDLNPSAGKKGANYPVVHITWYEAVEFCNKLSIKAGYSPYYQIDKEVTDPSNNYDEDPYKWLITVDENSNGFRLPSSDEWEYACRAGTITNFFWGDNDKGDIINKYSVYSKSKSYEKVGSKKPNPWQLYDMLGNVQEWCYDWVQNPSMVCRSRICRGGSFLSSSDELIIGSSNEKSDSNQYFSAISIGFRVARNL